MIFGLNDSKICKNKWVIKWLLLVIKLEKISILVWCKSAFYVIQKWFTTGFWVGTSGPIFRLRSKTSRKSLLKHFSPFKRVKKTRSIEIVEKYTLYKSTQLSETMNIFFEIKLYQTFISNMYLPSRDFSVEIIESDKKYQQTNTNERPHLIDLQICLP